MAHLSSITNNQSNTSLQQCPASLALQGLTKSRLSFGKREFSSMTLLSALDAPTPTNEPLDFPSLEWLHDDDVRLTTTSKEDKPERQVVARCLHEAIRLLNQMDVPASVERPRKRRRMVRSSAIPASLAALETASSLPSPADDLLPKQLPQRPVLSLRSEQEKSTSSTNGWTLTGAIHQDLRGKQADFKENSYSKSFKASAPRTYTLNCTVSPLA